MSMVTSTHLEINIDTLHQYVSSPAALMMMMHMLSYNLDREARRLTAKTAQGTVRVVKILLTAGILQCTIHPGFLRTEIAECAILVSSDMQTDKLHCSVCGAIKELPPRIVQCKPIDFCWARLVKFMEGR